MHSRFIDPDAPKNFDRYVAIPFKSKGRDYDGCDCWGQLYLIYRDHLKIVLEDYKEIEASHFREVSELIAKNKLEWPIVVGEPKKYDVVVMLTQCAASYIAHIGMMINSKQLIHTEERTGARIISLNDPFMKNRVIEIRRYREFCDEAS